jgi:uncharacterized protein
MLAMLRGKAEGILKLVIDVDPNQESKSYSSAQDIITQHYNFRLSGQACAEFLTKVVQSAWKSKLSGSLETDLVGKLREQAELEAIKVFSTNLHDLLMAAPAGPKVILGIDPGLRTGCKIAIVDATGKLLQTSTIFPHAPQNHWDKSVRTLVNLCQQHKVELIAIGNGTASRESDALAGEVIKGLDKLKPSKVIVSEAGASVYSASEFASKEFPDLDVSIRGAVSIARRLQDPLAELVKIDPKAIGVGQYQHDVSQSQLSTTLDNVIEDCVNAVGVDLNSASAALLTRVSGLNKTMAQNIVDYRDEKGRFNDRKELKKVPRLGPKAFEQAAGFLRIKNGKNPLDDSAVHPESYNLVDKIAKDNHKKVAEFIGNKELIQKINLKNYITETIGLPTLEDIVKELEKPGLDPREKAKVFSFDKNIKTISDLRLGQLLPGIVNNITNFGCFVDIGIKESGLIHVSNLSDTFVKDVNAIVNLQQQIIVKVLEVDVVRKRIQLALVK